MISDLRVRSFKSSLSHRYVKEPTIWQLEHGKMASESSIDKHGVGRSEDWRRNVDRGTGYAYPLLDHDESAENPWKIKQFIK